MLLTAAVAASAAIVAGGAVAGGALSSGHETGRKTGSLTVPAGDVQVEVNLCTRTSSNASCNGNEVTGAQRAALKTLLEKNRRVREVAYLTKQQHYQWFKARMEKAGAQTPPSGLPKGIPEAFVVTVPRADAKGVMQACLGYPGVDTVVVLGR
ncbi:hypothetical protein GCM10009727_31270 [Actinomadura napierensis]|uniref:FtsX extracellular domain-containing protein n=1 Tax=Actinomadura napierensis TaxID=267854 RepID=A0ABN2Z475_9ACTN